MKLIQPIDAHYQPAQIESIFSLLKKLSESAHIFLKVNGQNVNNKEASVVLAEKIIDTLKIVEKTQSFLQQNSNTDVLSLPLSEKYRCLLKDLRFGYMAMKNGKSYGHHYTCYVESANSTPPSAVSNPATAKKTKNSPATKKKQPVTPSRGSQRAVAKSIRYSGSISRVIASSLP